MEICALLVNYVVTFIIQQQSRPRAINCHAIITFAKYLIKLKYFELFHRYLCSFWLREFHNMTYECFNFDFLWVYKFVFDYLRLSYTFKQQKCFIKVFSLIVFRPLFTCHDERNIPV